MTITSKGDRWVKRWQVPKSSGDGWWVVAVDKAGNYACSCPVWKFRRRECHHIKLAKMGGGNGGELGTRPQYVLAKVHKPTLKRETNELLIPLVAIPDTAMMEVTICYYMLKYGYSMGEVREARHLPPEWTAEAIFSHINRFGEANYPKNWYNVLGGVVCRGRRLPFYASKLRRAEWNI